MTGLGGMQIVFGESTQRAEDFLITVENDGLVLSGVGLGVRFAARRACLGPG
jgi:hypothetical protein